LIVVELLQSPDWTLVVVAVLDSFTSGATNAGSSTRPVVAGLVKMSTQIILSPLADVTKSSVVVVAAAAGRELASETSTLGIPEIVPFLTGKVTPPNARVPILMNPTLTSHDFCWLASPPQSRSLMPPIPFMVMENVPPVTSSSTVPEPEMVVLAPRVMEDGVTAVTLACVLLSPQSFHERARVPPAASTGASAIH